jgi:hypothetical protein
VTLGDKSRDTATGTKPGIIRRIFAVFEQRWQRQAEREIARFIASRGGHMTDELERQLDERFTGRGSPPYA